MRYFTVWWRATGEYSFVVESFIRVGEALARMRELRRILDEDLVDISIKKEVL